MKACFRTLKVGVLLLLGLGFLFEFRAAADDHPAPTPDAADEFCITIPKFFGLSDVGIKVLLGVLHHFDPENNFYYILVHRSNGSDEKYGNPNGDFCCKPVDHSMVSRNKHGSVQVTQTISSRVWTESRRRGGLAQVMKALSKE
jgi:hypothetical protein